MNVAGKLNASCISQSLSLTFVCIIGVTMREFPFSLFREFKKKETKAPVFDPGATPKLRDREKRKREREKKTFTRFTRKRLKIRSELKTVTKKLSPDFLVHIRSGVTHCWIKVQFEGNERSKPRIRKLPLTVVREAGKRKKERKSWI